MSSLALTFAEICAGVTGVGGSIRILRSTSFVSIAVSAFGYGAAERRGNGGGGGGGSSVDAAAEAEEELVLRACTCPFCSVLGCFGGGASGSIASKREQIERKPTAAPSSLFAPPRHFFEVAKVRCMVRERYEGLMQSILNGSSVQATTLVLLDFAPLLAAVILGSARAIRTWRRRVQLVEKDRLLDVFIKEEDVLAIVDLGEDDLAPEQLKAPTALLVLPLMELAAWLAFSAYSLARRASLEWTSAGRLSVAASWAYCFCTELRKRSRQPPWSTFVIFIVLFVRACVVSTIEWHDSTRQPDYKFNSFLLSLPDLCICGALIIRVVDMPLGASFARNVDRDDGAQPNSPEDRNTLLGSLSYAWMAPLMSLARRRPLRPSDVWQLALTNRAAVLARRFKLINASTLFERIFRASARDVAIDTALKWVAVSLSYLRPFWIQRLLEMLSLASVSISGDANRLPEVEHAPWTPRDRAYLYAIAAFLSLAGASLAQLQHFHHARRVGMRLRSELTSSVYEKALKRKDLSGQVHAAGRTGETAPKEGGASTGRIVSLISDDTNKVLRWVSRALRPCFAVD